MAEEPSTSNEEAPIEEAKPEEESEQKEPTVYHVVGDSETVYVDGHKEERYVAHEGEGAVPVVELNPVEAAPVEEQPKVEESPVETPAVEEPAQQVEEVPVEKEIPEEPYTPKEEIIYHVIGDSEVVYVDGHKEERYIVHDDGGEEPVIEEAPQEEEKSEIPGEYIVKCENGYYVDDNKFSYFKKDAKVFKDFNLATQKKALFGGRVIKL